VTQKIEKRAAELLIANEELCFQNEEKDKRGTKLVIASEFRIAATVFESQEGMFITDANSSILRVNRAFTRIAGYSGEEAITVRADMGNALRKAIKYNQF
jgi:PAS domain-containing protein